MEIKRPQREDTPSGFHDYIDLVKEGDILKTLAEPQ